MRSREASRYYLTDGRLEKGSRFFCRVENDRLPPSLSLSLLLLSLCIRTRIYLVIVSFTAAGRPLGLFSPLRILHRELDRQRDIIKARMTPLLALLFIEIYAHVIAAVPYVHALVDSPTTCVSEYVRVSPLNLLVDLIP